MIGDDLIAIRWTAVGDGEKGGDRKAVGTREEDVGRKRRGKTADPFFFSSPSSFGVSIYILL